MAKSKSGGTRSYLRGRIASDVYSIGRDSAGKKQQVVRSLAEQVKNPQTVSQMRGRMIMSTVMQAVSAMALIIDHSFDGVPNGQPSISEFIRRNYALIKADVAAHPAKDNSFGLNKYQEKGVKVGAYQVSNGKAILPSFVQKPTIGSLILGLAVGAAATTAGAIRAALGIDEKDYFTVCGINSKGVFGYFRVNVSSALADDTTITEDNLSKLLVVDNPLGLTLEFNISDGNLLVSANDFDASAVGIIYSNSVSGGFEHSTTVLKASSDPSFAADVALPTYPEGTERFLNGGDL